MPKSVDPANRLGTTPAGSTRRPRSAYRLVQPAASGPLLRTGRYAGASSQSSSTPQPVISAAPRTMSAIRSERMLQPLDVLAAQVEEDLGALGDHVGALAAVGDDPVHAVGRRHLLAVQRDALVGQVHRVERVAAHERLGRGVRGDAGERRAQLPAAEEDRLADVVGERVHHQRRVDAVEGALAGHQLLAAAALLGRRAHPHHAAGELLAHRGEREERADAAGRDHVVAAGVADAGQRVVLAEHGDRRPLAERRLERRLHAVRRAGDLEAPALDQLGQRGRRAVLLEADLGVRGQVVRGLDQRRGELLDRRPDRGQHVLRGARGGGLAAAAATAARASVSSARRRSRKGSTGLGSDTRPSSWVAAARVTRVVPKELDAGRPARVVPRPLRRRGDPAGLLRRQLAGPAAEGHRAAAGGVRRAGVGRPADPRLGRALVRAAAHAGRPARGGLPRRGGRPGRRSATRPRCCSTS